VIEWYAVAYDVAGGISCWQGPYRWRRARSRAEKLEQSEYVSHTRVQRWAPHLQPHSKI
jgi:hypothetical protein